MENKILIICDNLPKYPGDIFLDRELKFASKKFDKILLLPLQVDDLEFKSKWNNVEVDFTLFEYISKKTFLT